MPDPTCAPEPSELVKSNPLRMKQLQAGRLTLSDAERRASGPQRLKEAFSSIPCHAQKAASDPNDRNMLYGSRAAWQHAGLQTLSSSKRRASSSMVPSVSLVRCVSETVSSLFRRPAAVCTRC